MSTSRHRNLAKEGVGRHLRRDPQFLRKKIPVGILKATCLKCGGRMKPLLGTSSKALEEKVLKCPECGFKVGVLRYLKARGVLP